MKLKVLMFIILGFSIESLSAQEINDSIQVVNFLKIFDKQGIEKAIGYMYLSNNWSTKEYTPDSTIVQLKATIPQLGKYVGYEFIKKKRLTSSLAVYSYLIIYEKFPVRFTFVLYKSDQWRIQNFNFDTNILDELNNSKIITWD